MGIERGMSVFTSLDTVSLYVQVMEKEGHKKDFDVINLNKVAFDA
jgi:hypothetical protein